MNGTAFVYCSFGSCCRRKFIRNGKHNCAAAMLLLLTKMKKREDEMAKKMVEEIIRVVVGFME